MKLSNLTGRHFQLFNHSIWIILFFLSSCAQVSAPTGGPKDQSPPKIKKAVPENYSLNFTQKEITIYFDEWIQPLQNPKSQVIISPSIEPFPKIEAARNELLIKWKDTLQSNTTYSIFFGDNIKDNNEGNVFPDFRFIFSTGTYIDSLQIKGKINTSLDKFPDNTYLLLYKETEDSVFTKKRPFYITKIQSDGAFNLENVKEGDYRIYALNDKNNNFYYDLPTEAIGFTDSIYRIRTNLDTLSFELFVPEENSLRITEFDRVLKGGILNLGFNKELSLSADQITVAVVGDSVVIPVAIPDKAKGKIKVYLPKLEKDTASIALIVRNNDQLVDTIRIRTESRKFTKPVLFFTDTLANKSIRFFESQPLKLTSAFHSLALIDTSRLLLMDSSGTGIACAVSREDDLVTYTFQADWKPGNNYTLQLRDSMFSDLVGNFSKNQEFSFSPLSNKKSGNLLITYELPQKNTNYIAVLKDNSGKVLDSRILNDSQAVKINYGLLLAGSYSIEVIEDSNGNGIWNSGNFTTKTLPEKIYKEVKPVIIKENWDAEEIIQIDFSKKSSVSSTTETESKNAPDMPGFEQLNKGNRKGGKTE
jgi:hypothetical protein